MGLCEIGIAMKLALMDSELISPFSNNPKKPPYMGGS